MSAGKKATPKIGENDSVRKIRELRSNPDLAWEQLAAKVGLAFSPVNKWENERGRPSPRTLLQIERLKSALGQAIN